MPLIHEIREIEQLEPHRLRWAALLARTPGGSFFQSLDWLAAYWRHFGQGQQLRVLVASSGGETIGIVPLVVRRERTRLGLMRVLTYPLHDWGSYYGPIGHQPAATLLTAMLHLKHARRDWDLFDLRWIDEQRDLGRTRRAMELAGLRVRRGVWDTTCLLDLPPTWEEFFAGLTSKLRNNVRRAEKRLTQQGAVTLERYRPRGAIHGEDDPRWELYHECAALAQRSWQGHSTTGTTLTHPDVAAFFRETHQAAARNGALDIALLRVNGRAAAFCYNYRAGDALYGLRTGYDPALAECGVGTVLWTWSIRDGIERGDRQLDLGVATKEVKLRWRPRLAPLGRLTHYPASPRSQLLAWKHRLGFSRRAPR